MRLTGGNGGGACHFVTALFCKGPFYGEAFVLVSLQRGLFTQNLSERSLVSPLFHDVHLLLCGVTRSKSLYAHANLQSGRHTCRICAQMWWKHPGSVIFSVSDSCAAGIDRETERQT